MVRQQLYRVDSTGGRTIAVSDGLKDSAWLTLLEQQLSLIDYSALSIPVYYQYPLGRGLVLSRCMLNPYTPERSWIAHQLVLDDAADLDSLHRILPLKSDLIPVGIFGCSSSPDPLPEPELSALAGTEEVRLCRETISSRFAGNEDLLTRFLCALSLCARDKRYSVRVLMSAERESISEAGRRIMELAQRFLSREDVLRLSYCSLSTSECPGLQCAVCFTPENAFSDAEPNEIVFNLSEQTLQLPPHAELPDSLQFAACAHELLHPDESVAPRTVRSHAHEPISDTPLTEYFSRWRSALESRKAQFTDDGFRAYAQEQWGDLLSHIVSESDGPDMLQFLSGLKSILSQIRREKLETALCMSENVLTDMVVILLDSIRWRQIDLSLPSVAQLIRSVTAYSQVLTEEICPEISLLPCRIIHRLLTSPSSIHASLMDLDRLEDVSPSQFESLQDCLLQYVQKRLTSDIDVIDASLAAAAMLGFAKFADGIPDLRLADKLVERIETQSGSKAARRFEEMLDKLRRSLHSSHGNLIRRRDMKLFIFISCLLLLLIAGISIGFLLLG